MHAHILWGFRHCSEFRTFVPLPWEERGTCGAGHVWTGCLCQALTSTLQGPCGTEWSHRRRRVGAFSAVSGKGLVEISSRNIWFPISQSIELARSLSTSSGQLSRCWASASLTPGALSSSTVSTLVRSPLRQTRPVNSLLHVKITQASGTCPLTHRYLSKDLCGIHWGPFLLPHFSYQLSGVEQWVTLEILKCCNLFGKENC